MRIKLKLFFIVGLIFVHSLCFAQNIPDYLILQDIGNFKFITQSKNPLTNIVKQIPGYTTRVAPGALTAADHFDLDHDDKAYEMNYDNTVMHMGVEVQVTQHAGSDPDRWLLHEVDREFRTYYGLPGNSFGPRQINGLTIIENLVAGGSYRWVSGTKVVVIEYHDSQMTKPEPIEVIQAYLAKHPSTMPTFTLENLRSTAYKTTWIKDEMDRRLWLCDKWFMQLQLQKVQQGEVLQQAVKSMNVFLDYREKYYGDKTATEKNILAGYLNTGNGTGIKTKLDEYKKWWSLNKDKAINL